MSCCVEEVEEVEEVEVEEEKKVEEVEEVEKSVQESVCPSVCPVCLVCLACFSFSSNDVRSCLADGPFNLRVHFVGVHFQDEFWRHQRIHIKEEKRLECD
ncbi:unnamed protein product, partial [Protopolystoma xenopodis]